VVFQQKLQSFRIEAPGQVAEKSKAMIPAHAAQQRQRIARAPIRADAIEKHTFEIQIGNLAG
jgi:hypothetical protein